MNVPAETFSMYFQHGLPDGDVVARHWTADRYNEDLTVLGVSNPALKDRDVALLHLPYMQDSRLLHDKLHPIQVGNVQPNDPLQEKLEDTPFENWDRAAAVMRFGADDHDVAYPSIDADAFGRYAWPRQVRHLIDGVADWEVSVVKGERLYGTFLTEKSQEPEYPLVRMAADLFGASVGDVLNHKTGGGNEFGSSLTGMQFLKKYAIDGKERPLDRVYSIAIAAIVAATVPFRPNASVNEHGVVQDGLMERLARRVHDALLAADHNPKTIYRTTNAITAMAACVANRDTGPFTQPDNAAELTHGARQIRAEEIVFDGRHAMREPTTTMSGLSRMAYLQHWAPGLYQKIIEGTVPAENVGKFVVPFDSRGNLGGLENSYPPQEVHAQATLYAKENVTTSRDSLALHQVGITIGRNFLRATGDLDTEVPGGVDSRVAAASMARTADKYADLLDGNGKPSLLYRIAEGELQETIRGIPRRSPLAAFTLAAVGFDKAMELSGLIQDHWAQALAAGEIEPYFDTARSKEFQAAVFERFTLKDYNTIIDVLILAAELHNQPDRVIALERLKRSGE